MQETLSPYEIGQVLIVDKPLGWTSFDVVNKIRYQLKHATGKRLKVGHAGTLDPLASGVLVICTGKFTKRIDEFQAQEKEYTGMIVVGATTPCCDLEKEIDAFYPVAHITDDLIHETIRQQFTGNIFQVPPVFSAIKVGGKRAYESARSGEAVTMPPREVTISAFEVVNIERAENAIVIHFRIVCSKGTYIRSIARDLGVALNSGAYLGALRRTRIGQMRIEDGKTMDEWVQTLEKSNISAQSANKVPE